MVCSAQRFAEELLLEKQAGIYAMSMAPGMDLPAGMTPAQFEHIKEEGEKFQEFKKMKPLRGLSMAGTPYPLDFGGGIKIGELDKQALLERLIRLGATDIPGTPRLLMKHRSPEELASLQHGVEALFGKVQDPVKKVVGGFIEKVPSESARKILTKGTNTLIENPELIPMQPIPIPGLTVGYLGAKKGAERLIDKFAPIEKKAFQTSMYSGPLSYGGFKQESDLPGYQPYRMPKLKKLATNFAKPGALAGVGGTLGQFKPKGPGFGGKLPGTVSPSLTPKAFSAPGSDK